MSAFILLLASYGFCFGLMNNKGGPVTAILRKSSFLEAMFRCPYCTGFHTGWIVGTVAWAMTGRVLSDPTSELTVAFDVIVLAWASSAFCYCLDVAAAYVDALLGRLDS